MELWIRSQDRTILLKANSLAIDEQEGKYAISEYFVNGYEYQYMELGQYKTKERALEILDEIQKLLIHTHLLIPAHSHQDKINNHFDCINKIYEMPEE